MESRKKTRSTSRWVISFVIAFLVLLTCLVADLYWSEYLMSLSIEYSKSLIQLRWLKFLMFFFSYIIFFGIFAGNIS